MPFMASLVKENGFYYLRHNTRGKDRRRYVGKSIPKDIEERKRSFIKEFYREEWDRDIQKIAQNYKRENRGLERSIETKNFEGFGLAFTYNTQRIEGSTLTESDTRNLLVHGLTPSKKSPGDTVETQRHYDLFMRLATEKPSKITKAAVLKWHKEIFGQTRTGETGSFRSHRVGVTTSPGVEFATVREIPGRTREFFSWLNSEKAGNPVEFAAMAHYKFVSIHPFADGNGRLSRLIMNCVLLQHGCPMMLIRNRDRAGYFKSLEKSQLADDEMHFLKWFMRYYVKNNQRYLQAPIRL